MPWRGRCAPSLSGCRGWRRISRGKEYTHLNWAPFVLGIALVAQFAADLCREAGLAAAASAVDLCGRALALLQALPLLQQLLDAFAGYLQ